MLSQYCDASRSASGRRSRSRELASPRRHSFSEFRPRAGRVRLDLPEGPASGLRVRGGPHVALDLLDAGAAALEAPEVQVPIPADFLLDVTAAHLHRRTTEGNDIGEHEVIAVLSCFRAYDSPVCRVFRMDSTRSSGGGGGLATRRCAGCARERSSGRFRAPHNVHYVSRASFAEGCMDEDGPFFEDFRVGTEMRSKVGRTVTETDNVWFTLLTGNGNQIHFNEDYTRRTFPGEPFLGRRVVNGFLTVAIAAGPLLGTTSPEGVPGGPGGGRFSPPVFHRGTVYSEGPVTGGRGYPRPPRLRTAPV